MIDGQVRSAGSRGASESPNSDSLLSLFKVRLFKSQLYRFSDTTITFLFLLLPAIIELTVDSPSLLIRLHFHFGETQPALLFQIRANLHLSLIHI